MDSNYYTFFLYIYIIITYHFLCKLLAFAFSFLIAYYYFITLLIFFIRHFSSCISLSILCSFSCWAWVDGNLLYYYFSLSNLNVSPCRYSCLFLLSNCLICLAYHFFIPSKIFKSLTFLHCSNRAMLYEQEYCLS